MRALQLLSVREGLKKKEVCTPNLPIVRKLYLCHISELDASQKKIFAHVLVIVDATVYTL